MSLYAFHLGQIISTVLLQVDHGGQDSNPARIRILDETHQKTTTTLKKTTLLQWYYLPNHKSFGYSEVIIWFRDGNIGVVIANMSICRGCVHFRLIFQSENIDYFTPNQQ